MKPRSPRPFLLAILSGCLGLAALLSAHAQDPATDDANAVATEHVRVSWTDTDNFAETRESRGRGLASTDLLLQQLGKHLSKRAERQLAPGQRLDVRFTDLKLAGGFEPWHGPQYNDVRIIKDIYPPRMELSFTLTAADGSVIASGDRKLRDMGFLTHSTVNSTDNLRYEKRMLDDWLRREFSR